MKKQINKEYNCWNDKLTKLQWHGQQLAYDFNNLKKDNKNEKNKILQKLLGKIEENVIVNQPIRI